MLRLRQALEALKVPHLVELALDHAQTSRVVIFAHFKDTLQALRQKLEKHFDAVPIIDGSNTADQRAAIQAEFQANRIPVLLCNAEAGGIALSLHDPTGQVDRTTLISPGWSARQFKQILGRVHRDGGAYSQQRIIGFAGTLEERIVRALAERCDRIDLLNDGLMHGVL
jgi:superfamily II DNA or RNA helicase